MEAINAVGLPGSGIFAVSITTELLGSEPIILLCSSIASFRSLAERLYINRLSPEFPASVPEGETAKEPASQVSVGNGIGVCGTAV